MVKATASPKLDRTIQLRDGRTMAYSEWGDLGGRPLIWLHGSPASRLFCPDEEATEAAGVRFITMDRPGYGRSDPLPGRTILDWPDDLLQLADQLDLPPSPVVGWSSGGPYALAVGLRASDRVTTIGLAASTGPMEHVPGDPEGRAIAELLSTDRTAGIAAITLETAWLAGDGLEAMFEESWGDADDLILSDRANLAAIKALTREAARQGSIGFTADEVAEYSPWGFSVADIIQRAYVWSGAFDSMVGRNHTDYLAATIPNAIPQTFADAGHLLPINHWAEMLAALP